MNKADRVNTNVTFMAPVRESMKSDRYIQLFLESTLYTIVAFILILSAMLIYSLMISDIDEKTYEMAMLRALGLRTKSVVYLILMQSCVFAFPGLLVGLVMSALINLGLRIFVVNFTASNTTYFLANTSIPIAVFLGIFMPIFTNLFTIQRALGKKIRDSLDIFHTGANDVIVKIRSLEDHGISLFSISLGLVLVIMGVLTYYLAPAAFLFDKLDIFFVILNLVLISMIIGMGFLWVLVFPFIQKAWIHVICFIVRPDLKLKPIIMKNLSVSHQKRNSKTSILFTIWLAYLIFGGSSLLLINNLILGIVKNIFGADLFVGTMNRDKHLPEQQIREFLYQNSLGENANVSTYTFSSLSLTEGMRTYKYDDINTKFKIHNGGDFPKNSVSIMPVEEHFFDSIFIDYYIPMTTQKGLEFPKIHGKDNIIWSLYSDEGTDDFEGGLDKYNTTARSLTEAAKPVTHEPIKQIKIILPEGIGYKMSAKSGNVLKMHAYSQYFGKDYQVLIRAMPRKIPGYLFTSYRALTFGLQGLASYDQAFDIFLEMLEKPDPELEDSIKNYKQCKIEKWTPEVINNGKRWSDLCPTYFYKKNFVRIMLPKELSDEGREEIW